MVKRFTVYPGDAHFAKFAIGAYGWDAWQCAICYLNHHRTFVDVGAHIGHFVYNAMGKFRRIVAIEPMLLNISCLRENVLTRQKKLKRKPAVNLVHALAGAKSSHRQEMWVVDPSKGTNSGAWEFHDVPNGGHRLKIDIMAIDDLGLDDVDLIKIDTQGWEGRVIDGAATTIKLCKPVIIVENMKNGNHDYSIGEKISAFDYGQRAQIQKNGIWMPNAR